MKRRIPHRRLAGLAIGTSAAFMPGCDPYDVLWFGLGTLLASRFQSTTVEYQCFRDGIPVDCATLPDFVPPVSE